MHRTTEYMFVYGSLRSGFRNPAYDYLTQYFSLLGNAVVRGKLYDNGLYPVAVPTEEDVVLHGELYKINNPLEMDWAFMQLDDYEGLNVEQGETPLYRRGLVSVFKDGAELPAWVYWFNGSTEGLPEIEGGDMMKYFELKNK